MCSKQTSETQASGISPRELIVISITCLQHKSKIVLSLSRYIEKQLGKQSKNTFVPSHFKAKQTNELFLYV